MLSKERKIGLATPWMPPLWRAVGGWAPATVTAGSGENGKDCCRRNNFVMSAPEALHAGQWGRPLERIGRPNQMAAAVMCAASDQASALTATTIGINDGMSRSATFV
jgi:NAD(P)-dependent dehydrogenase (short-subunit alcohol dehydrogenase family)